MKGEKATPRTSAPRCSPQAIPSPHPRQSRQRLRSPSRAITRYTALRAGYPSRTERRPSTFAKATVSAGEDLLASATSAVMEEFSRSKGPDFADSTLYRLVLRPKTALKVGRYAGPRSPQAARIAEPISWRHQSSVHGPCAEAEARSGPRLRHHRSCRCKCPGRETGAQALANKALELTGRTRWPARAGSRRPARIGLRGARRPAVGTPRFTAAGSSALIR
jgi:hypothetical protein